MLQMLYIIRADFISSVTWPLQRGGSRRIHHVQQQPPSQANKNKAGKKEKKAETFRMQIKSRANKLDFATAAQTQTMTMQLGLGC